MSPAAAETASAAAEIGSTERDCFISSVAQTYSKRLHYYFKRQKYSDEDSEDLVQETLFRLCTVGDLGQIQNIEAFLYTTAYRLAVDLFRKETRTLANVASRVDLDEVAHEEPSAEDYCVTQQELAILLAKVRVLPKQRRRTFVLRKFSDMSYQDIAEQMGITIGSVRKHLSAALQDCRSHLTSYH